MHAVDYEDICPGWKKKWSMEEEKVEEKMVREETKPAKTPKLILLLWKSKKHWHSSYLTQCTHKLYIVKILFPKNML